MTGAALLAEGGVDRTITEAELLGHLDRVLEEHILAARRVLLVPPDHTRLHSRAGLITGWLFERIAAAGRHVEVLPAVGTHAPMTPADTKLLFGDRVPYERIRHHGWRDGVVTLGQLDGEEVQAFSGGRLDLPILVEVAEALVAEQWDLIVSVGQVLPHEVIGMANFTKNLVVGLGGASTIHRTHFLGAVCDMETIMGQAENPVRATVDTAFERFLAARLDVLWLLTVMQDTSGGVVQRGMFAGWGCHRESGGVAFREAAALSASVNIVEVESRFDRLACWLDPAELRTTWLGNKAVYRTRMAMADGGELLVLAPGVRRFSEDAAIDALIRRHGYRGTPATIEAVGQDTDLAANLGAAAHLIHGSSEGRFRIVYCTDPSTGGASRDEIEGVGYGWRSLPDVLNDLGVTGETPDGRYRDRRGEPFNFLQNPALGLWRAV